MIQLVTVCESHAASTAESLATVKHAGTLPQKPRIRYGGS